MMRLKFNLVVNSSNEGRVQVAENIKSSLENIGIKINIIKANDENYKRYLENKNYDMILTGKYTSFSPNLSTYFGAENLSNYNNDNINKLIDEINNVSDEKIFKDKINQIVDIYIKDIPFICLYYNRNTLIYSTKLMGDINPNNYNIFYNIGSWYRQ